MSRKTIQPARSGNSFLISMYLKPQNRASVVFRKNRVQYRLTTILGVDKFWNELNVLLHGLGLGAVGIMQLQGARQRQWILEMGVKMDGAAAYVWEMIGTDLRIRFQWKGSQEQLRLALSPFSLPR